MSKYVCIFAPRNGPCMPCWHDHVSPFLESIMAKVYGLQGNLVGKIANTIYAVNHGVNIARTYNAAPANPSTEAQVEARAKLKLLSQISAIVKAQIAISRVALKTARNIWTAVNYPFVNFNEGAAEMAFADMQLTKSQVGFPGFRVERVPGYGLSVELLTDAWPAFDKVVWIVYRILEDGKLMINESKVVTLDEDLPKGATVMQNVAGDCTIHCYGISTVSASAKALFEGTVIDTAEQVARLMSERQVSESDVTLTETRGLWLKSNENEKVTSGAAIEVRVQFDATSALKEGTLVGGGVYHFGETIQVSAPAVEGYTFSEWWNSTDNRRQTNDATFTYVVGTRNVVFSAVYAQA